jgi:hypothetical protein
MDGVGGMASEEAGERQWHKPHSTDRDSRKVRVGVQYLHTVVDLVREEAVDFLPEAEDLWMLIKMVFAIIMKQLNKELN